MQRLPPDLRLSFRDSYRNRNDCNKHRAHQLSDAMLGVNFLSDDDIVILETIWLQDVTNLVAKKHSLDSSMDVSRRDMLGVSL